MCGNSYRDCGGRLRPSPVGLVGLLLLVLLFLLPSSAFSQSPSSSPAVQPSAKPISSTSESTTTNILSRMTHEELLNWANDALSSLIKLTGWYKMLSIPEKDLLTKLTQAQESLATQKNLFDEREAAWKKKDADRDRLEADMRLQITAQSDRADRAEQRADDIERWLIPSISISAVLGFGGGTWFGSALK